MKRWHKQISRCLVKKTKTKTVVGVEMVAVFQKILDFGGGELQC